MVKKKESEEKLAVAMEKLADRLEKFQDPVMWQKVISDAVQMMPGMAAPFQLLQPPLLARSIESISIKLSDDERDKIVDKVFEAVKPQLEEFGGFVRQSLAELPPHRLKDLAEKIEKGEKPQIKKRRGCVFLSAGDVEVYLGL